MGSSDSPTRAEATSPARFTWVSPTRLAPATCLPLLPLLRLRLRLRLLVGPPRVGPYAATNTSVKVPGYKTGGSSHALMTYPTSGNGPWPVVAIAHGMAFGGGLMADAYLELMMHIATHGYIVIGPESCEPFYCWNFDVDVLHTITYAQQEGASLHPIFGKADFTRMGAVGHSMGGASTVKEAGNGDKGNTLFKGAVAMHPSSDESRCSGVPGGCGSDVNIPILYMTGTADIIVFSSVVKDTYKRTPSTKKAFYNLDGASHMEPTTKGDRWGPYVSAFLNCEVAGDTTACPYVWTNSTGSLCATYKMAECDLPA